MRRVGIYTIIFLLLLSTAGMNLHYHFCGNKLVYISLFKAPNCCKLPCRECHTKLHFMKVHDSFMGEKNLVAEKPETIEYLYNIEPLIRLSEVESGKVFLPDISPPGKTDRLNLYSILRV